MNEGAIICPNCGAKFPNLEAHRVHHEKVHPRDSVNSNNEDEENQ